LSQSGKKYLEHPWHFVYADDLYISYACLLYCFISAVINLAPQISNISSKRSGFQGTHFHSAWGFEN